MNNTRNDQSLKYSNMKPPIILMNGGHTKETYDNNKIDLIGVGFNRWENLFFNPQKNACEPFLRIGENTVNGSLDQWRSTNICDHHLQQNQ
jgi:hypothetical protein